MPSRRWCCGTPPPAHGAAWWWPTSHCFGATCRWGRRRGRRGSRTPLPNRGPGPSGSPGRAGGRSRCRCSTRASGRGGSVRVALRPPAVAGLGVLCAGLTSGASRPERAAEGATVKGRSLVNHWIEVVLEPSGALALHDRRTGERFFDVLRLEDGGDAGDTYTYCPPSRDRVARAAGPLKVRRGGGGAPLPRPAGPAPKVWGPRGGGGGGGGGGPRAVNPP